MLLAVALACGVVQKRRYADKLTASYPFQEGDVQWTGRNLYMYPALSAFAGVCGGLLGIGGGMIMGPLLLELGMKPMSASATSATTVMVTSGAAAFQKVRRSAPHHPASERLRPRSSSLVIALRYK